MSDRVKKIFFIIVVGIIIFTLVVPLTVGF